MTKEVKAKMIIWDWKEKLEISRLEKALSEVYSGQQPGIKKIIADWDQYAILVSSEILSQEQVQDIFENRYTPKEGLDKFLEQETLTYEILDK